MQDHTVIRSTVSRIPAAAAVQLLRQCISKLHSKPNRGQSLITWIRPLLTYHTSYLMTVPGINAQLSSLYQIVDARVGVFKKLMMLHGRLDLLLEQVSIRRQPAGGPVAEPVIYHGTFVCCGVGCLLLCLLDGRAVCVGLRSFSPSYHLGICTHFDDLVCLLCDIGRGRRRRGGAQ